MIDGNNLLDDLQVNIKSEIQEKYFLLCWQ
jgi:hypothetical protein